MRQHCSAKLGHTFCGLETPCGLALSCCKKNVFFSDLVQAILAFSFIHVLTSELTVAPGFKSKRIMPYASQMDGQCCLICHIALTLHH